MVTALPGTQSSPQWVRVHIHGLSATSMSPRCAHRCSPRTAGIDGEAPMMQLPQRQHSHGLSVPLPGAFIPP